MPANHQGEVTAPPVLSITVHATWDGEAGVGVATSEDIDGLAIEAETIEALEPRVKAALADLIELNGIARGS